MANTPEAVVPIVDNGSAPDIFADLAAGGFLLNGNIHVTLTSQRCDYREQPGVFTNVVIGHLVMPLAAAENMVQFLGELINRLRAQSPIPPISDRGKLH